MLSEQERQEQHRVLCRLGFEYDLPTGTYVMGHEEELSIDATTGRWVQPDAKDIMTRAYEQGFQDGRSYESEGACHE